MEDDFGMELLVCGNIISLNLPVRLVFECVWRPSLRGAQRGSVQQSAALAAGASANNVLHVRKLTAAPGPCVSMCSCCLWPSCVQTTVSLHGAFYDSLPDLVMVLDACK